MRTVSVLAALPQSMQAGGDEVTAVVVGLIVTAVPAVIGWLIVRAVRAVDRAIENVNKKLDHLVKQDTEQQVEVADLRARVVHLELFVFGGRASGEHPAVKS